MDKYIGLDAHASSCSLFQYEMSLNRDVFPA